MTENEAIEALKNDGCYECSGGCDSPVNCSNERCYIKQATKEAIKALEEIQQYRAIGTAEDLQTMKDNGAFSAVELAKIAAMLKRLKVYEAIGTVEEFKAFKEKNVAKKPIDKIMYLECPTCGDVGILDCGYCSACGQKLDWQ